jgi:hypothetical protein
LVLKICYYIITAKQNKWRREFMKRVAITIIVLSLFVCLVSGILQAGVSITEKVQHKDPVIQNITLDPAIHRVVKGYARMEISPNFYKNDWDATWWGTESVLENYASGNKLSSVGLTTEEVNFLTGLTGMDRATWYSIDLTDGVITSEYMPGFSPGIHGVREVTEEMLTTSGFEDYTKTDEYTEHSLTYVYDPLNPFEVIELHEYTTYITVQDVTYQVIAVVYDASPLVLDLDKNNRIDVANNDWRPHAPLFYGRYAKFFDMTGNGTQDFTEWKKASPADGLLVMPENGRVEGALQLLGTAGGYRDGFEKLSIVFDKDQNGWIEGQELNGLMIWIDRNNDAICQPDELHPLSDFNIARISTGHNDYVGKYQTTDGVYHTMWDWWPAVAEVRKVRAN